MKKKSKKKFNKINHQRKWKKKYHMKKQKKKLYKIKIKNKNKKIVITLTNNFNKMDKLIKKLQEKAKACGDKTKEDRARKGAYIDCIVERLS